MGVTIGQVGSGTYTDAGSGSSGLITLTWGGTTTSGSDLFAFILVEESTGTTWTPAGAWAAATHFPVFPYQFNNLWLYGWYLLNVTSTQSGGINFQGNQAPCTMDGILLECKGANINNTYVFDPGVVESQSNTGPGLSGPSLTTGDAAAAIIGLFAQGSTASSTSGTTYSSPGSGYAISKQVTSNSTTGLGCPGRTALCMLTQIPGVTGTFIPTVTSSRTAEDTVALTFCVTSSGYVPGVTPMISRQPSQVTYFLPDYNTHWYQNYYPDRSVQFILPLPPPTRQPSQRFDPLPELWQQWANYVESPFIQWWTPPLVNPPPTRQPDQRWDALPDYNFNTWEQWKDWPVPVSFVIVNPPPSHQASQIINILPDYTYNWYEQIKDWPIPVNGLIPNPPLPNQASQRWDALPDYNFNWYQQWKDWPIPVPGPAIIPLNPALQRQASQVQIVLPDYWQEWVAYVEEPIIPVFLPTPPATRQPSQRWDALPDWTWEFLSEPPIAAIYVPPRAPSYQPSQRWVALPDYTYVWYEQTREWPIPVNGIPVIHDNPLPHQSSQRWDDLPYLDYAEFYQYQRAKMPLPSTFYVTQEGLSSFYTAVLNPGQVGGFRVQNNLAGYTVYVTNNAPPILPTTPTTFSQTLPINISIAAAPPGTTKTVFVLVRARDHYGLESQNQYCQQFVIDDQGNLVMPPLLAPADQVAYIVTGEAIQTNASYAGALTDQYPADTWYFWITDSSYLPTPGIDVPTATAAVNGTSITMISNPGIAPGNYNVSLALYRTVDNSFSPLIYVTITMPPGPNELVPVPSGFQQYP